MTKQVISYRFGKQVRLLALAALFLCTLGAKGQNEIEEGFYYIHSRKASGNGVSGDGFNANDPLTYYYLCPTVDWRYYQSTSPYHTITNTGMPFMTTYQCRKPATPPAEPYDVREAVWYLKKYTIDDVDYYSIRHAIDNKYLTFNRKINSSKPGRIRVHLESSPANGNDTLFSFSYASGKRMYDVIAKGATTESDGKVYKYLNVNKGNQPSLQGTDEENLGGIDFGGTIGTWTSGCGTSNPDDNSQWNFLSLDFLQAPIITEGSSLAHYVINLPANTTLPTGFKIRYTLDNTVIPGLNTGREYTLGDEIEVFENGTMRAWIAGTIGTYTFISAIDEHAVVVGVPEPTFLVTCGDSLVIQCEASEAEIYYSINTPITNPDPTGTGIVNQDTIPSSALNDNGIVYAFAYLSGSASNVVNFTYHPNTVAPTNIEMNPQNTSLGPNTIIVTLEDNNASTTILYYTIDGTDPDPDNVGSGTMSYSGTYPAEITIPDIGSQDLEFRIVAKLPDRGASCPVTVVKRPKRPTFTAACVCIGTNRQHVFTLTGPAEAGKTYWCALKNGSDQPAPDLTSNTFMQCYPNVEVDITTFPGYDGSTNVTLFAYAKDSEGNCSAIQKLSDYNVSMAGYTPAPTITYANNTVNITAPSATIHYKVDENSWQTATNTVTIDNLGGGQSHTITAWAQSTGLEASCEAVLVVTMAQTISTLQQLQGMTLGGSYVLGADITGAGAFPTIGTESAPFTGSLDGAGYTISGLTQPLFGTTNNAVIHDINLKQVNISGSDTLGAVVCVAKGYTRVYNCGILPNTAAFADNDHPSVSTSGNCAGSIVGSLRDDSRVVNCFSYADVTAANSAAGIVGFNQCASDASVTNGKYTKLRTMVVNCMYYGDISSTNAYPVYGGRKISNAGSYAINNYNFYSDSCSFQGALTYNCSWPAKHEYLTRYEFHRYLLNSNRELCGWWVGAHQAPSTMATSDVQGVAKDASLMAKWVLKTDEAPFPILKPFGYYPSPVNIDADAAWRGSANEWEGKKLGTLSVTVNPGEHAASWVTSTILYNVVITDMDTLHGDYCYRKIQLPYYNRVFYNANGNSWVEKYAGNYTQYVVTGWEITSVQGGTTGSYSTDIYSGYNFADRDCTEKDTHRIFAQGGYYYVPNDVTAITITAHWGNAYYLGNGDNYYDRVDFDHLVNSSNVVTASNHPGTPFAPAGRRNPTLPNDQQLRVGKLATVAAACITTEASVYDNAIVLVGNHQYCTGDEDVKLSNSYSAPLGFTIMSADFDLDNEPDYCLEWQLGQGTNRYNICPIRFDFLPVVEIGLALKKDGSQQYYSLGCYRPIGHYEVTETSLIRFGQFEFGNPSRTKEDPLILNAGIFEQYVKGTRFNDNNGPAQYDDINYIIIGGNIYMPAFTPGAHVNRTVSYSTRHCAVNVIGGKYDYLYLTGNYNENVVSDPDNPHCYIDGGWLGHVAAAGKEGIDGNVTFKINHARINEFYGGSTMSKSNMLVTGNIEVTVDNSIVNKYCGGPKFGDMAAGKTVTTNAKGTTFGVYYGGGNGGTNYVQYKNTDKTVTNPNTYNWSGGSDGALSTYTAGAYIAATSTTPSPGYMANYDMELINTSSGTYYGQAVARTYFYAAQYSATNTGKVTNTLDNCIVKTNFYGAGNLGGVVVSNPNEESVKSTLKDTQVHGSVYGAGFSAKIPQVTIYAKYNGGNPPGKTKPTIDLNTGLITPQSGGSSTTYTWIHDVPEGVTQPTTASPVVTIAGENYFYTEDPLENLGMVNGNVTLTLKGDTSVGTLEGEGENQTLKEGTGNVFGGGDMSKVNGSTTVKLQGNTNVLGNVYGGGNEGEVVGNSQVTIQN